MSQNLIKLTSLLILGLFIGGSGGCSSDSDPSSQLVVVTNNEADSGDAIDATNTDTGTDAGADSGNPTGDSGDDTATAGETTAATTEAGATAGNTDAGIETTDGDTDDTATAGTGTTGTTATAGNTTESTATDAGIDGLDTTTGGTTDDTGTITDGTATATAGTATDGSTTDVTDGSDADAGNDSAGTEGAVTGETAGTTTSANDGTTAGTDTDGGTTTTGPTVYPEGSLAYELSNIAGLTTAFFALQAANLDEAIDDPENSFTLFLPINEAFVDLASPADFVLERHKAAPAVYSGELVNYDGRALNMDDGSALIVEGDTARTLTIAGANVLRADVVGTNGSTSVVHIIDTVIPEPTVSPYPPGSLTDVLFQRGDMTNALAAINAAFLVGVLNDPINDWTMFLPTDSVLTDPDDLNTQVHLYLASAASYEDLVGLVGTRIRTNGGHTFLIGGGGTDPLTIGNVEIVEADLQSENELGTIVHIIDGLMMPDCCDN